MHKKQKFRHTCSKQIKNKVAELGYPEDIKIDKDIRFLLRQEMKEMGLSRLSHITLIIHSSQMPPPPSITR